MKLTEEKKKEMELLNMGLVSFFVSLNQSDL